METKYTMNARATIVTDDGCDYDSGLVFPYKNEESFESGIKELSNQIFNNGNYIIYDSMGANVIPVNRIATIRVDKDIPTV